MTTSFRIALISVLASAAIAASSVLGGCSNDVPTPPWYPNYEDSGYGPKAGAGGLGGAAGKGGGSSASGAAGEGGDSSAGASGGEAGDGP